MFFVYGIVLLFIAQNICLYTNFILVFPKISLKALLKCMENIKLQSQGHGVFTFMAKVLVISEL